MGEIYINFELELIVDSLGEYKKGDIDYFTIPVLNEQNGLARFPIEKQWKILSAMVTVGGSIIPNSNPEYGIN